MTLPTFTCCGLLTDDDGAAQAILDTAIADVRAKDLILDDGDDCAWYTAAARAALLALGPIPSWRKGDARWSHTLMRALWKEGHRSLAVVMNARLRTPCGADLTPVILAVPEDGKHHLITCPSCGATEHVERHPAPALEG